MFSPDGKSIYFSSMKTGNFAVYSINTDGTNKKQLTFPGNEEENERVNVSRDAKYFIYNKRSGSTISIMRSS
jgi:Tol biopolymer transport system component